VNAVKGSGIQVAAKNCHAAAQGAYTGEVSVLMLKSLGVTHCIVGHSERRQYFGETDALVTEKLKALLFHSLTPISCCGEKLGQREAGKYFPVVEAQLKEALDGLSEEELGRCIIAYEPVWAIGTGRTASTEQAQEMHAFIREYLTGRGTPELHGVADRVRNTELDGQRVDVADGWTTVTVDGMWSAQFEHTLLITEHGVEVLTEYEEGEGGRLQALEKVQHSSV
jgi:triosephosphate isomerase